MPTDTPAMAASPPRFPKRLERLGCEDDAAVTLSSPVYVGTVKFRYKTASANTAIIVTPTTSFLCQSRAVRSKISNDGWVGGKSGANCVTFHVITSRRASDPALAREA